MALEVYVGPLCRFFGDDWERVAVRQAHLDGFRGSRVGDRVGPGDAPPALDELQAAIGRWQTAINAGLKKQLAQPLDWNEDITVAVYRRSACYEGYSGLLLWAAYTQAEREPPSEIPRGGWVSDPLYRELVDSDTLTPYRAVLQPEIWLPCDFDFCFEVGFLNGQDCWVGSSWALVEQLELLNRLSFGASRVELRRWLESGRCDASSELEQAARLTLALFLEQARRSVTGRLPMLLSY